MAIPDSNYEIEQITIQWITITYPSSFYISQELKIRWEEKINLFILKYSFYRPLASSAMGGRTIRHTVGMPELPTTVICNPVHDHTPSDSITPEFRWR
jgi:hypothetical protein